MNGEYVLNWLIEDADRNANDCYLGGFRFSIKKQCFKLLR